MVFCRCAILRKVVLDIAAEAGAGETPRRPQLAIHYDEIARKTWEEKRGKLGCDYDLGREVCRSVRCACVYLSSVR